MSEAEAPSIGRLAELHGNTDPRSFVVNSLQERVFEDVLGLHTAHLVQGQLYSRNVDLAQEAKRLNSVIKALRRAKVVEWDRDGQPVKENLIILGQQIIDAVEFIDGYKTGHVTEGMQGNIAPMTAFVEGLIADFPTAPVVEQGLKALLGKVTRHGK